MYYAYIIRRSGPVSGKYVFVITAANVAKRERGGTRAQCITYVIAFERASLVSLHATTNNNNVVHVRTRTLYIIHLYNVIRRRVTAIAVKSMGTNRKYVRATDSVVRAVFVVFLRKNKTRHTFVGRSAPARRTRTIYALRFVDCPPFRDVRTRVYVLRSYFNNRVIYVRPPTTI